MLTAPNLDDRRFQDLVDDAKRLVQQRCPEWTDHNVSDPGVTLIETFAFMVDQLLYRLNRVPPALYVRFLDLLGIRLFPPTAAACDLTFWLAAPQKQTVRVPRDSEVATVRAEVTEEPVLFTTGRDLDIVACTLTDLATLAVGGEPIDRAEELATGEVRCFADVPQAGDCVLFGLSDPVPGCAVLLRLDCVAEGVGVDPRDPPLVWEAWTPAGWQRCEIDSDDTGGLNKGGDLVLHVPYAHAASILSGQRAGWLRCRVVPAVVGQPRYSETPRIRKASAATVGGSVPATQSRAVRAEVLGSSTGVPGQRFALRHRPVVPEVEPLIVEVSTGDGWEEWRCVDSFAGSGPEDRHIVLDAAGGEIIFGPAVREVTGTLRQFGAVPPKDAVIRVPFYRTGGGRRGNVARGLLRVQREPVPFVSRVENRRAARGGVDGETLDEAAVRAPLALRTRDRAVTAEDYEQLARQAAPEVARVRCVAADDAGDGGPGVRVLVVPACERDAEGRLRFADLLPSADTVARIGQHLDERRCLGARVVVEPPFYRGVTVVAQVEARRRTDPELVQKRALTALYDYLDPLTGGSDADGWPFGRPVHVAEIFGVLQSVPGVELVTDVRLFGADPRTGDRGQAVTKLEVDANAVVFSYQHRVRVSRG
jgi:predicted phage baseplate assembly protein